VMPMTLMARPRKSDSQLATHQLGSKDVNLHGFNPVFKQSAGGHTWLNWRDYLNEFAPQLFQ